MKRTGEILQKAREQKGLSINEIGLSLKISSKILKAIEDGDLDQLPAKTFLRGFVQSYASYLRLDVNDVLRIFQEEMGSTRPSPLIHMPEQDSTLESFEKNKTSEVPQKPASNASTERPLNSLTKQSNSRTLSLTLIGLVLVGLIIFTKKMIDKYQKEGTVAEVEVAAPLPSSTPVATSEPVTHETSSTETSSSAASSTVTSAPAPVSTPVATPTPVAAPATAAAPPAVAPTPKPVVAATPVPTPIATPSPRVAAAPTPAPTPTPAAVVAAATPAPTPAATPTPAGNKPVEVIFEALDNVEVTATSGDGKSEKIALAADQVHTFKSKNGLKINISNGGAVNVIVNGKDLGIPGNLGKPTKLSF